MAGGNPRRANGSRRTALRRRLAAMGRPCWICGAPIDYGLPAGHPHAFEADELVPVSKGGDPLDPSNVAPAHRCCNGWRKARSVAEVEAARSAAASLSRWSGPSEFVEAAKEAEAAGRAGARARPIPRTSTDW